MLSTSVMTFLYLLIVFTRLPAFHVVANAFLLIHKAPRSPVVSDLALAHFPHFTKPDLLHIHNRFVPCVFHVTPDANTVIRFVSKVSRSADIVRCWYRV